MSLIITSFSLIGSAIPGKSRPLGLDRFSRRGLRHSSKGVSQEWGFGFDFPCCDLADRSSSQRSMRSHSPRCAIWPRRSGRSSTATWARANGTFTCRGRRYARDPRPWCMPCGRCAFGLGGLGLGRGLEQGEDGSRQAARGLHREQREPCPRLRVRGTAKVLVPNRCAKRSAHCPCVFGFHARSVINTKCSNTGDERSNWNPRDCP